MNKKVSGVIAIIALGLVAFFVYNNAVKPKDSAYNFVSAERVRLVQDISETGMIEKGVRLDLNFTGSGRIEKIGVAVGQHVRTGEILAQLDSSQLRIQLDQAESALQSNRIRLDKLMNGASEVEIRSAATKVQNAEVALANANQSLKDVTANAEGKLAEAYGDAMDVLESAYAKAYNARNFCDLMQRTYFAPREADSILFYENCRKIESETSNIKSRYDAASKSGSGGDKDAALAAADRSLAAIAKALKDNREICEEPLWRDMVAIADRTTLDSHRDLINTSLTSIRNAIQTISSQKITNDYNINAAKASVDAASGALQSAKDSYDGLTAAPRSEDASLLQAQIRQSEAQVQLLKSQINDTILVSPVDGQVAAINLEPGETAQPMAAGGVVSILPSDPYEITVDIYEEDIVKVKPGNEVSISLIAFPDRKFSGKVTSVEPGQKLVNGIVYYETKISFNDAPENLKPGMSADIVITTASKDDVLAVPESSLQKKGDTYYVQVLENGLVSERTVQTGLKSKNEVEITDGLREGEKVIIP